MIQEEGATKIEWAARLKKRSGPLDYNIGRCVPMWESGTPIGATGTDTALNFHVYFSPFRVPVCRRELDFLLPYESRTPISATGTNTALNFHVYFLLSSRVPACRRELDFLV